MSNDSTAQEARAERGRLWRAELDAAPKEIAQSLLMYLHFWEESLQPAVLSVPPNVEETGVFMKLQSLLAYARTGNGGRWSGSSKARTMLWEISALCHSPLYSPRRMERESDDGNMSWVAGSTSTDDSAGGMLTEIARAAWARVCLEEEVPVPRAWLAALAGCAPARVREAVTSGELVCLEPRKKEGGKAPLDVTAKSARTWLFNRGVMGL